MNVFHPLVSIIVPVYNGSNYMKEAIESALKQTYDNLEIIVVNDGSNDNGQTEAIAKSYEDKIHYYSKPNGGTASALNLGIKHMKGEYFSWLSHDDQYYPDKITRQVDELAKLDDKNTIMMTDLDGINERYEKIYQTDYNRHIKEYPSRANVYLDPIIYNQTHGCTLLIPKACFDKVGLFNEKIVVAEDFEFFYRAFSCFPHKLIPEVLVTARDSSNRKGRTIKKTANEEYSRLFIHIIEDFCEADFLALAPSRLSFYLDMESFYESAEYSIALAYIRNKMLTNLQISSYDLVGKRFNGHNLHLNLRKQGIHSRQLVLNKQSDDDSTYYYDFSAPNASKELMEQSLFLKSDIIHLHLVHNILDLNYLPLISKLKPVVITLHDRFFLGGHCIHSADCNKWKSHCADCPHLDMTFPIFFDYSALNFALKRQAIQNSQITAIVASKWMQKRVEQSPIWTGKKIYYLPFGIDQTIYHPVDQTKARKKLHFPEGDTILMLRADVWEGKGLDLIIDALERTEHNKCITLIAVGQKGLLRKLSLKFNIIEYDWLNDDQMMANLYQSCDLFIMPSRQEAFGLMAVEAMSCGKMVLALESDDSALPEVINAPTCGLAVKEEDFSIELGRLLSNKNEMRARGVKCAAYAAERYAEDEYLEKMISIYREVISNMQYDEDTLLLLDQLKKHTNDTARHTMSNTSNLGIMEMIRSISDSSRKPLHQSNSWRITKPIRAFQNARKYEKKFSQKLHYFGQYLKNPAVDMQSDEEILRSRCWRITAPLRKLARPIKRKK
jgi:glycosyltransferase involved in cell wall biosynthesis